MDVGPSASAVKRVQLPVPTVEVLPHAMNEQEKGWRDIFEVTLLSELELEVRRVDADAAWGQKLMLYAVAGETVRGSAAASGGADGVVAGGGGPRDPDPRESTASDKGVTPGAVAPPRHPVDTGCPQSAGSYLIEVGPSASAVKRVRLPVPTVVVLPHAVNEQKREWRDTFEVTLLSELELEVRRVDAAEAWGQKLVLYAVSESVAFDPCNPAWPPAAPAAERSPAAAPSTGGGAAEGGAGEAAAAEGEDGGDAVRGSAADGGEGEAGGDDAAVPSAVLAAELATLESDCFFACPHCGVAVFVGRDEFACKVFICGVTREGQLPQHDEAGAARARDEGRLLVGCGRQFCYDDKLKAMVGCTGR